MTNNMNTFGPKEIEDKRHELYLFCRRLHKKRITEVSFAIEGRRVYRDEVRFLRRSGPYGLVDYVGPGYVIVRFELKRILKFLRLGRGLDVSIMEVGYATRAAGA